MFDDIRENIPIIWEHFKMKCERPILKCELGLKHLKAEKKAGNDGLSAEFYYRFWDFIEAPLMNMYKECIMKKEMSTAIKQGLITLLLKANGDPYPLKTGDQSLFGM